MFVFCFPPPLFFFFLRKRVTSRRAEGKAWGAGHEGIDLQILQHVLHRHPGSPRYIADRIAGQILYPGLSNEIVQNLADTLVLSSYELKPMLKRVLGSEAMFSELASTLCVECAWLVDFALCFFLCEPRIVRASPFLTVFWASVLPGGTSGFSPSLCPGPAWVNLQVFP